MSNYHVMSVAKHAFAPPVRRIRPAPMASIRRRQPVKEQRRFTRPIPPDGLLEKDDGNPMQGFVLAVPAGIVAWAMIFGGVFLLF